MKETNEKTRSRLQRVIGEIPPEENGDVNDDDLREILIDPNDVICELELPMDKEHLWVGAMIGVGSIFHHAACPGCPGGGKEEN